MRYHCCGESRRRDAVWGRPRILCDTVQISSLSAACQLSHARSCTHALARSLSHNRSHALALVSHLEVENAILVRVKVAHDVDNLTFRRVFSEESDHLLRGMRPNTSTCKLHAGNGVLRLSMPRAVPGTTRCHLIFCFPPARFSGTARFENEESI
eukprot:6208897-Pleurochrysis_carterae.AAC.5